MKRALTVLTLTALIVTTMAAAALAAWLAIGSGNASSSAASVQAGNTPTAVASGDDVTVSWTASTLSNGTAVAGYVVKRYDTLDAAQTVGANCAGTIATLTCTENNVPNGAWKYSVTPKHSGWTGAESAKSVPVVIAGLDTTPPSATITFPASGGSYNVAGWNAGCSTASTGDVCGTASDSGGSGLSSVKVSIRQGSGDYWGGSAFDSSSEVFFTATGTSTWSYDFSASNLTNGSSYTVKARATDGASNTGDATATFTFDTSAPTVTLTAPTHNSFTNDTTPDLGGAAGNATGDGTSVTVKIYSGIGTGGTVAQTLTPTRSGTAWSATASTLVQGTYTAQATQTDAAGNTGTSSANTFTVDTDNPSGSDIQTVNKDGGTAGQPEAGDQIVYTFTEQMLASSIKSGWDGTSTSVTLTIGDNSSGGNDAVTVSGVDLGTVSLERTDYVSSGVTFTGSTMVQNGAEITITLGTHCTAGTSGCGIRTGLTGQAKMKWTPSSAFATDRAGNTCSTSQKTETGSNNRNF